MAPRFNMNAQGPTTEITAEEADQFITPEASKTTKWAEKMALNKSTEPLPNDDDGKTSRAEYDRRHFQELCFFCGKHPAKYTCRGLHKKNPDAAIKASKDAGGDGAAPVYKQYNGPKKNYRN
ncbi:unnamed protein product [Cercospora beticola]|nr:unnamed protein product [Cercospora beticola]